MQPEIVQDRKRIKKHMSAFKDMLNTIQQCILSATIGYIASTSDLTSPVQLVVSYVEVIGIGGANGARNSLPM